MSNESRHIYLCVVFFKKNVNPVFIFYLAVHKTPKNLVCPSCASGKFFMQTTVHAENMDQSAHLVVLGVMAYIAPILHMRLTKEARNMSKNILQL